MSEMDTMTPSVMRYSEQMPMATPVMDMNFNVCIPSNGGSFTPNQEIRIPFNVPQDCFVDLKRAYLKIRVTNDSAADQWFLDPICGVASFIDTWRVVGGTGALLEETIHYNALASCLNRMNSTDHQQSRNAIMEGTSINFADLASSSNPAGVAADTAGRQGILAGGSKVLTHIPHSAFFNADKYMPLGYTQGTSYLSLTLASANTPMACLTGAAVQNGAWTIDQVELHLPVMRAGAEFAGNFRTLLASGMPLNIHSVGFQNSQQNVAAQTTGNAVLTFSTRKRSVKSLLTYFRINAALTSALQDSASAGKALDITRYQYSVGGIRIPSQEIAIQGDVASNDTGEVYANNTMALGHFDSNLRASVGGATGNTPSAIVPPYIVAQNVANNDRDIGSLVTYCLDLETYGEGLAGKNLAGQGLPLVLHANLGTGGAQNVVGAAALADLFVIHDIIFKLDGTTGVLTASS
tara:strand:- start:1631 stop:3025 length:1395 start_codon:yes stop_codon:yes gene_type:complete